MYSVPVQISNDNGNNDYYFENASCYIFIHILKRLPCYNIIFFSCRFVGSSCCVRASSVQKFSLHLKRLTDSISAADDDDEEDCFKEKKETINVKQSDGLLTFTGEMRQLETDKAGKMRHIIFIVVIMCALGIKSRGEPTCIHYNNNRQAQRRTSRCLHCKHF